MAWPSISDIANNKVLYLTTVGRMTGLPREIEIWFVLHCDRFYLFAETGEAAAWVKNIRSAPEGGVRIGGSSVGAKARILDREIDRELWAQVGAIADRKYGWSDGLLVEVIPIMMPNAADTAGPLSPAGSC